MLNLKWGETRDSYGDLTLNALGYALRIYPVWRNMVGAPSYFRASYRDGVSAETQEIGDQFPSPDEAKAAAERWLLEKIYKVVPQAEQSPRKVAGPSASAETPRTEKQHFYLFSFTFMCANARQFASSTIGFPDMNLSATRLNEAKARAGIPKSGNIVATSYLGFMTETEMNDLAAAEEA